MMKPSLCLSLAASATLMLSANPADAAVISIDPTNTVTGFISLGEWNTNGDFEGWSTTQVTSPTVSGGFYNGSVLDSSNDPQPARTNFSGLGIDLSSGDYSVVEIRVRRSGTASRFDMFWGTTAANGFIGTRRADDQTLLPSDGNFHIIQFDMSGEASWTSTLDDMRIDPFSDTATGGRSFQLDYIRVGTVVPEPSGAALLVLGGLALIARRRCR